MSDLRKAVEEMLAAGAKDGGPGFWRHAAKVRAALDTTEASPPALTHLPVATDAYMRLVTLFDQDATAASFLSEDGDGGFVGGVYRMAREIERLRQNIDECAKEGQRHE